MMKKKFILFGLMIVTLIAAFFAACSDDVDYKREEITFEKTWVTIQVGEEQNLVVTTDIEGEISYTTSNEKLVTVSDTGKITGVAIGTAEITASIKDNSSKCFVTVIEQEVTLGCGVSLDRTEINLYLGGRDSYQLSATVTDNGIETEKEVLYSSSDALIATVDSSGNVKAVGLGSAYITVSTELNGEKTTAVCKVQVREMLSLAFKTEGDITVGESFPIQTEIRNASGEVIERPVSWSTKDDSIVTVNSQGLITGKSAGRTQIVAKINDEVFSLDVLVYSPIKNVQDLIGLNTATYENHFRLMNDITIKVNGIEAVEEGSDAKWTMYDVGNKRYSLLDTFNGVLDGNGYKITLINTTPVEGAEFSGLFRALGANSVVKNTVFDIQIAQSTSGGYVLCAYTYGTINDCVIKVKYAGANAKVFRQLISGCVNNVIFDLSNTNITALFNSSVSNTSVNNIIVTGQGAYNASNIVNYSGTRGSGVIYTSHADAITAENFGYDMDKNAMATKLDFGNEGSWTFDYVNNEIKLCGKTVLDKYSDYTQISTVSDFMKIDDSVGKFVLTNDITIKVDGVGTVKDGCDAPWTNDDIRGNKIVSLLGEFRGVLDGNGYKVTIVSETGVSDLSVMFGGVFADIAENAVIKNTVFDIQIATIKNIKDGIHIFCGWLRGTVENCYIKVGPSQGHKSGLRVIRGTDGVSGTMNNVILDLLDATNVTELTYKPENVKNISNIIMIGTTITYSSDITTAKKFANYESVFTTPAPLTGESWTFDVENKEIKLCGKTVATN